MAGKQRGNGPSKRQTGPSNKRPGGPKRPKAGKRHRVRNTIITLSSIFVGAVVMFVVGFYVVIQMTPFDAAKLNHMNAQPTVVYDGNNKPFLTIASANGYDLPYEKIPTIMQDALVATEDHNFWDGSSIDLRGILRAAFYDVWTRSASQGASTIQEELAKMVYLNDDKTLHYKLREIALGIKINRHYTKQEILAMYLNRVFLGENCIGVEEAAMRYFGVDLSKGQTLTLEEAALLAGLPQAPSAYDPLQHPKAAMTRRNEVLDNMARYGYLTQQQADKAKKQPLNVSPHAATGDAWDTQPLFMNFLLDNASRLGITAQRVLQGGLQIYTTVDPKVQNALQQVFYSGNYDSDFPPPINGKPVEGAAVFVNPATGGILGSAGSRKADFYEGGLDRAFSYSQPGSSIKPIMEYGPAIESGKWGPDSILDNVPHDFGGGYIPQNDSPGQPAQVTLEYALEQSENVASVWLLSQIGIDTGVSFAENDGIQFTPSDKQSLAIAIGGMEAGVTPMQMAQAYEPFDNGGIQMAEHLINRVINANGDTIYQFTPSAKRVMSTRTAAIMTNLMVDVAEHGTGTSALIPGLPVAGKTGTVQYDLGLTGSHPGWISRAWWDGFTPNMVGSVYLGYDTPHDPVYHLYWDEAPNHYAELIWKQVVSMTEAGQNVGQFPPMPANADPVSPASTAGAVTQLNAEWDPVGQGVALSWSTTQSGSVSFVVSRKAVQSAAGQLTVLGQTPSVSYEDTTATPGQTYNYLVQAINPATGQPIGAAASVKFTVPTGSALNGVSNNATNGTGNLFGNNATGNLFGDGNGTNTTGNTSANGTGNNALGAFAGNGTNGVGNQANGATNQANVLNTTPGNKTGNTANIAGNNNANLAGSQSNHAGSNNANIAGNNALLNGTPVQGSGN